YLRRLLPDVLTTVRPRLSRHAAPLPRLSAGISSPQRHVHGRRFDSGRRLRAAADVLALVIEQRAKSPPESLVCYRPECQTTSPPPVHNFERQPIVTCGPYEYSISQEDEQQGDARETD